MEKNLQKPEEKQVEDEPTEISMVDAVCGYTDTTRAILGESSFGLFA